MEDGSKTADSNEVPSGGTGRINATGDATLTDRVGDEPIGVTVVEAVSAASGVDPCRMDTRLYDVVDPDALERIVRNGGPDVQVSFEFGGYRVCVFGDGEITVADEAAIEPPWSADE